jgi:hypothetical protein
MRMSAAHSMLHPHAQGIQQEAHTELNDGKWSIAKPEDVNLRLILQLKDDAEAKVKNGRLHYDETTCSKCRLRNGSVNMRLKRGKSNSPLPLGMDSLWRRMWYSSAP